jgi:hypothetical protein
MASTASSFHSNTLRLLDGVCEASIASSDLEQAFELAEWAAHHYWKNSVGVYRRDDIEQALADRIGLELARTRSEIQVEGELHVVTKTYAQGGHTPLLRTLISTSTADTADVLATQANGLGEISFHGSKKICPPSGLNRTEKIEFLVTNFVQYKNLFLYIHPDDLVSAVALRIAKTLTPEIQIYFVNHADHLFSVGIGIADVILEISAYGWMLRGKRSSANNSHFVGIPIASHAENNTNSSQSGYAMTGGSSYKYKPSGGRSLPKLLEQVLASEPKMNLMVVGPRGQDSWWWRLRLKYPKRITIKKLVARDEYRSLLENASVYIDSYPVTGGTAFPEALMNGKRVAGLASGLMGYSAADPLKSSSDGDFVQSCLALFRNDRECNHQQERIRELCHEWHSPERVRARIDRIVSSQEPPKPLPDAFRSGDCLVFEANWLAKEKIKFGSRVTADLSSNARKVVLKSYSDAFAKKPPFLFLLITLLPQQ